MLNLTVEQVGILVDLVEAERERLDEVRSQLEDATELAEHDAYQGQLGQLLKALGG